MSCKNCSNYDFDDKKGGKGYCSYYRAYYDPDDSCSHYSSSSSSGGCFFTSACVAFMGKPDDCMELETMRSFRDTVLMKTEEGKKLIRQYYEIAPEIVKKIDGSEKRAQIYRYIYRVVLECVEAIRSKEHNTAVSKYRTMVEQLQKFSQGERVAL